MLTRITASCLFLGVFSADAASAACLGDAQTLCLLGDRFMVQVDWRDEAGNEKTLGDSDVAGVGEKLQLNDSTGVFSLFGPHHYELMVKVLDGCAVNDRFWVFSAATTNVEYTLRVTDTETGQIKAYVNPFGVEAKPVTDTSAFEICAAGTGTAAAVVSQQTSELAVGASVAGCTADATTMCLQNDRFAVSVDWELPARSSGAAIPVNLTDQSGYFWFFSSANPDLLLNIYDGTAKNGKWWVFFSGVTNVGYQVRVEDTLSGEIRTYENPFGSTSTVLDNGFDDDGVDAAVEAQVPGYNGSAQGDGDGNGIQDNVEPGTASVSSVVGDCWFTVTSAQHYPLRNVMAVPSPPNPAIGAAFPCGMVSYEAVLPSPGAGIDVEVFMYPPRASFVALGKSGPLGLVRMVDSVPDNSRNKGVFGFHGTDGGELDEDGTADSVFSDPVGPIRAQEIPSDGDVINPARPVPTLLPWGVGLLGALLGFFGYRLRRRR